MMKITGLSHLFKWENLHHWWLTKYVFAPLYIMFSLLVIANPPYFPGGVRFLLSSPGNHLETTFSHSSPKLGESVFVFFSSSAAHVYVAGLCIVFSSIRSYYPIIMQRDETPACCDWPTIRQYSIEWCRDDIFL